MPSKSPGWNRVSLLVNVHSPSTSLSLLLHDFQLGSSPDQPKVKEPRSTSLGASNPTDDKTAIRRFAPLTMFESFLGSMSMFTCLRLGSGGGVLRWDVNSGHESFHAASSPA